MTFTKAEAEQLATLYDAPVWKTFRKHFLENRQLEYAQNSSLAPNWEAVVENRGRIIELRQIEIEMKRNSKKLEAK